MKRTRSRSRSPVQHANFTPSGILNKYENRQNGEVLVYSEPLDSQPPDHHWELFEFSAGSSSPYHLHSQASFPIGQSPASSIPLSHPSISKQHAVVQFRSRKRHVLPFLIDLNSKHGTFLNGKKIEPARFIELRHKDLLSFGSLDHDFVLVKGDKLISRHKNEA
jgi:smad nuclear-interacting protein 1